MLSTAAEDRIRGIVTANEPRTVHLGAIDSLT
jgi:hypothetical protein